MAYICISLSYLWNKDTPYNHILSEWKSHEQFKYDYKLRVRAERLKIWIIFKKYFRGPQNSSIFTDNILLPHPTQFSMPFLKSSGYSLSENVYFCRGRVNIFKVMATLILIRAQFPNLGDVTQKGASSKRMASFNLHC